MFVRIRLSRTIAMTIFLMCLVAQVRAQGEKGSLTDQFPKMSAKERARIAAKEVSESAQDQDYQAVMKEAESAFQQGRFSEAMAGYEKARSLRPYNVYPKVKIEDLKALIKKQSDEGQAAVEPLEEKPPPPPVDVPVSEPSPPVAAEQPSSVEAIQRTATPATSGTPVDVPDQPAHTTSSVPPDLKKADGLIERRYKEGNAYVIERTVTVDGRLVVYKRVFHSWGQVYYFEDGAAVDERVWNARFPK